MMPPIHFKYTEPRFTNINNSRQTMTLSNLENISDHLIQAQEAEQLTSVHRITLLRWAKRGIAPTPQKIKGS